MGISCNSYYFVITKILSVSLVLCVSAYIMSNDLMLLNELDNVCTYFIVAFMLKSQFFICTLITATTVL